MDAGVGMEEEEKEKLGLQEWRMLKLVEQEQRGEKVVVVCGEASLFTSTRRAFVYYVGRLLVA